MEIEGKVAIVTGGGGGIGGAIARALAAGGARVIVADLDGERVQSIADDINAQRPGASIAVCADVASADAIRRMLATAEEAFGAVDMYFANAGIAGAHGLPDDDAWDLSLDVNLRAHIRAANLLVPQWLERGEGYFVSTASAAGLLTQIGSATYAVSKHAAVGFAEWLSVTYGDQGVRVSCLCPQGVKTEMLFPADADTEGGLASAVAKAVTSAGDVLEPVDVAEHVLAAIKEERFLILPHPQVLDMYRHKGADYDRWLRGMRRYQQSIIDQG